MAKTILRIETPVNGYGMYLDGTSELGINAYFPSIARTIEKYKGMADVNSFHPSPYDDSSLDWGKKYNRHLWSFGFADKNQLRRWTLDNEVRMALDAIGFVVRKYKCEDDSDFIRGQHQAIFRKDYAKVVQEFKVTDFNVEA